MREPPEHRSDSDDGIDQKAMDRLRDRTDELELIISSLTIFALFSLPGLLFNTLADIYTHLSTGLAIAGTIITRLLAGVAYGLGACFVVHLMARAYWVGLIGLRAAFPDGINWLRTPGLGPLSRRHYRRSLPPIDAIIGSTDRLASSLFAVISMLTLGMLWFGAILVSSLVFAGTVGARVGSTNGAILLCAILLLALFVGVPILVYFLDARLATRYPGLQQRAGFVRTLAALRHLSGLAYPRRLILPVQLTLQSNTRPLAFLIALALGVAVILTVGNLRVAAWRDFSLSREFTYLPTAAINTGFRSTFYEDMASAKDRLRAWPRVDSFTQSGSFARLFLPYQPLRDNLVLDSLCNALGQQVQAPDCLRQLWAVSIAGRSVPMSGFMAAERGDLQMRGLLGLVPLNGLAPGLHRIDVTWNPNGDQKARRLDDRYIEFTASFSIPIAFSPGYERSLDRG